jgi:hypothetical protein
MKELLQLQAAVKEARARLGDANISTQVHAGMVDVVRTTPPATGRGHYGVAVLKADMTPAEALEFLRTMGAAQ